MNTEEKALLLIQEINNALNRGTLHYRTSDGKLLKTPKEIVEALVSEGNIEFRAREE